MKLGTGVALLGVLALVVTGFLGWNALRGSTPFLGEEQCTATVDGRTVELTVEQAENAAVITAIAVGRGMPARAATIALATAYQESELYNIDYGDRDSLGLFQQRPSQGWGTREQVLDPVHAANAFYDELADVAGYESMEVTVAAQRVQRSAFPDAYADHEDDARVLASALTGNSRAALTCELDGDAAGAPDDLTASGLVRRAEVVREEVEAVFGEQSLGGFAPGGVRSGHMEGSTHYEGRAVDIFFRPVTEANKTAGWAVAQYLVAMADRLDVQTVIFDGRIWKSGWRSGSGWREYDPPSRSGDRAVLEHRDHVHVDVFD